MIPLKDIINQVKYSELSGLNLGNSNEVGVNEYHYNEIIANINNALLEIHAKIPNPLGVVYLTLDDNITLYQLNEEYLSSNIDSEQPVKYLSVPSGHTFNRNVTRIVDIVAEDTKKQAVRLNDTRSDDSVWIRSNALVEVLNPSLWDVLRVTYEHGVQLLQSDFDKNPDVLNQTVDIKQDKLRPIVKFIVYQMMSARPHLDPQNTRFAKRSEFYTSVTETMQNESVIDNTNDDLTIFERNGFI